ncbi:alanyl-tRNA editing protein [Paenibacillus alvei]|uniref:alanyl-tRNA editing protein n=1 Tax=Paenibacillus alvei TaxID=44250 RepID=UPI0018CFCBA9|nr:DHHA1 domain-containing protein [Paenibacillus alvei]MBG9733942.1 hydrolase [Paenibacillus alvei]MBG9745462.1 hydrolase [Paenibacillus alvei]MCY9582408.1 DHHA1 domain-containing protein [Paenibacillus alvei]MCY9587212.1 DHHA1 domain-containing protein [Paenibacillus alvei]
MTKKLYYESAYIREWKTRITRKLEREDGTYLVLNETAFYPYGGGQPCDLGWINKIPVLDVILEEGEILHKVEHSPEQEEVDCRLNWDRRFDHMQHHSGQHLLSAMCLEVCQAETLSFHLGEDYATIDVARPDLPRDQLMMLELEVNDQIYLNRKVTNYVVTQEQAAKLPLVKQPKVTDDIRIVEIEGIEYNACGGTHVSATGEIGIIKLLRAEKQKGHMRIYFKCGYRALNEFNAGVEILSSLAVRFNTGKEEILVRIEKWDQEQKQLQAELNAVKAENDAYLAEKLLANRQGSLVKQVFTDKSLKDMQNLAAKLTEQADVIVLFVSNSDHKVLLARGGADGLACGAFFKQHLADYRGKGGGSDKMAQAGFATRENAEAFYQFAAQSLQGK